MKYLDLALRRAYNEFGDYYVPVICVGRSDEENRARVINLRNINKGVFMFDVIATSEKATDVAPMDKAKETVDDFVERTQVKIQELKNSLIVISSADCQESLDKKYRGYKQQILNTAQNMIAADKDEEEQDGLLFEGRLKSITELKKAMFSIKCDTRDKAHKANGSIKYKISGLQRNIKASVEAAEFLVKMQKQRESE